MKIIPRAIYYLNPKVAFKSIAQVIFNNKLERSKTVEIFEKEFCKKIDQNHGRAVGHARIALFAVLKALNLPAESEVLMTPINLPDMANAIYMNSLTPRYLDYLPDSIEPDLESAEKKINDKTKIFFYTHLYGIVPDLDVIKKFCEKHNLIFIQDCTQSVGAKLNGVDITNFSTINIFSLCDLKVIQTHRGGMITSNNSELIKRSMHALKGHETKPSKRYFLNFIFEDFVFSILLRRVCYNLIVNPFLKFLFSKNKQDLAVRFSRGEGFSIGKLKFMQNLFGDEGSYRRHSFPREFFYRFTNLQAEIGLISLKKFDDIEKARIKNSLLFLEQIDSGNKTVHSLKYNPKNYNVFWKTPLFAKNKEKLQLYLFNHSIDAAPINLPVISSLPSFANEDLTPNAQAMRENGLCIPLHHYLKEKEIHHIITAVKNFS